MKDVGGKIVSRVWGGWERIQDLRIHRRVKNYTMIPRKGYCANLRLARRFLRIPGAIVECGTWKGGMSAGMASVFGKDRQYFLYDSFEGLPEAKIIDGEAAQQWQADKNSPHYYNNCKASAEDARLAMASVGVANANILKGWFEQTLPHAKFQQGIALLRMDGDWYDSTICILNHLFPQVNPGGCVVIDDYHCWEGCSKAVHDYLSRCQRPERVNTFDNALAYIVKR